MASQNEMHQKSGNEEIKESNKQLETRTSQGSNMETGDLGYEPFSDQDPYRTDRINQINSEAAGLLESIRCEPVGLEGLNQSQYQSLYKDAEERSTWSKSRQDAFTGLLRLGQRTPRRSKRVL